MTDSLPVHPPGTDTLLQFAIDMANSLSGHDRLERLLSAIRARIPCDAVVLLQRCGNELKPLAQHGLEADALGRRFDIRSHPRFAHICQSRQPVRFESDCNLPDPYDGMLQGSLDDVPVHACMGVPLLVEQQLIGVLTLDSLTPGAFARIPDTALSVIGTMAAASLKTAILLQHLEDDSAHSHNLIQQLSQQARHRAHAELIGESTAMQAIKRELALVAPSDFAILIEGETGVGKELVARNLHDLSHRRQGPLIHVNCAAIPENLVESELFGHVKGAFTGADRHREGKFSLAHGGTLFLDEIGELPLPAQGKLLRALQNQEIQPVGQDRVSRVDVRVLAATNRTLLHEVEQKRFRADLYHRLNVYPVKVPPLRERADDTTLLAGYFLEHSRRKLGLQQLLLSSAARAVLQGYHWPGNVRELEHVIGRAALIAHAECTRQPVQATEPTRRITRIESRHLADIAAHTAATAGTVAPEAPEPAQAPNSTSLKAQVDAFQARRIRATLQQTNGNWAAAARLLDMDRANLVRLAKRLGIQVVRNVMTVE